MKGKILRRLAIAEQEVGTSIISAKDKIVVVTYPNGNKTEFERKLKERMDALKKKYGLNITEDDFLVIGVRKFYSKGGEKHE